MTDELLEIRWQHFEQRRKEKIKVLLEERLMIMNEEAQGIWGPNMNL